MSTESEARGGEVPNRPTPGAPMRGRVEFDDTPDPEKPCGRATAHPKHLYAQGRRGYECPGLAAGGAVAVPEDRPAVPEGMTAEKMRWVAEHLRVWLPLDRPHQMVGEVEGWAKSLGDPTTPSPTEGGS